MSNSSNTRKEIVNIINNLLLENDIDSSSSEDISKDIEKGIYIYNNSCTY